MPIIIANDWTARRESVEILEDGTEKHTGALELTFWEAIKQPKHLTNKKKLVEANYGSPGEIVIKEEHDEEGEPVKKYYQVLHQHRITSDNVKVTSKGTSGWSSTMSDGSTLCLPKNRGESCEIKEMVTVLKNGKEVTKEKAVKHMLQTEEQLAVIFEGLPAARPKSERKEISEEDKKKMSPSLRAIMGYVM